MNELTIITTIEVTKVYKHAPECFDLNKEELAKMTSTKIKEALDADDVVVTNIQEFVREEPEWHQG